MPYGHDDSQFNEILLLLGVVIPAGDPVSFKILRSQKIHPVNIRKLIKKL